MSTECRRYYLQGVRRKFEKSNKVMETDHDLIGMVTHVGYYSVSMSGCDILHNLLL